jgi:hypothetical protein
VGARDDRLVAGEAEPAFGVVKGPQERLELVARPTLDPDEVAAAFRPLRLVVATWRRSPSFRRSRGSGRPPLAMAARGMSAVKGSRSCELTGRVEDRPRLGEVAPPTDTVGVDGADAVPTACQGGEAFNSARPSSDRYVSLIISTSSYDVDLEYEQARLLIERGVESIIVVGSHHRAKTLTLLDKKRVPCVFTYTTTGSDTVAAVGFDNEKAGRTAARYLLDLGHTQLGMIAGITQDNDRARGRRDGFHRESRPRPD